MIDRRRFVLGTGLLVTGCAKGPEARTTTPTSGEHVPKKDVPKKEEEEEISPAEDLMREHGVLDRVLLVYEEGVRRLSAPQAETTADAIARSAEIVHRFIEQYHEKLEEDFLFPRFEKANRLVELVATLRRQHQAGRALTDDIRRLANVASLKDPAARPKLAQAIELFVRMYRPHEAREDTVLFPALRSVVPPKELDALGERFEDKEHELFGKEGFEGVVEQVAAIERSLGIHDLDRFTPTAR